jgi:RNA polymerase sigma-70 factor (ECF subfamily)
LLKRVIYEAASNTNKKVVVIVMEIMKIAERSETDLFSPRSSADVITQYQDMIYRIAFIYCQKASDAEDIVQEVFFRYIKSNNKFNDEEHLKAWLIRVAVNVSKSLLRSAWFKKTVSISEHENLCAEEQEETDTYYAVLSLPEKYRSVVLLYYFEEYTVREIAKILCRSEAAIQIQLHRARAILKEKLKEEQ